MVKPGEECPDPTHGHVSDCPTCHTHYHDATCDADYEGRLEDALKESTEVIFFLMTESMDADEEYWKHWHGKAREFLDNHKDVVDQVIEAHRGTKHG